MVNSNLKLVVPTEESLRLEIRNVVENHFSENPVPPPISYDRLMEFANEIISINGWSNDHFAFVMVCCGNAIWRHIVKTIPFNRRILLLPECLKNSSSCKAPKDELGLLCSECGNCSISNLLKFAESKGYMALVSEGSTVASRLIESGKVDAVIGVGCMEVLQKMFVSVTKYAIPGIGVPLLTDGCKDTFTDIKWLKQEIGFFQENNNINVINLNHLKNRVNAFFCEEQIIETTQQHHTKTEQIAREALIAPGHRWRPFFAVLTYEALATAADNNISKQLAISVECFHKASLIHDDIEDNDPLRNGKKTVHEKYGIPVALNIGDLLIGEGYRLIARLNLPAPTIANCLTIAAQGHTTLTIGQGEELLTGLSAITILPVKEIIDIFENKTAAAFKVSLLMGATAAQAGEKQLNQLSKFSKHIGIGYQIKDDLTDFYGYTGDIAERKFSILLSLLFEESSSEDKRNVLNALNNGDNETIFQLIEQYKIKEKTESLLVEQIQLGTDCLQQMDTIGLKLALHEILGKIFGDYI